MFALLPDSSGRKFFRILRLTAVCLLVLSWAGGTAAQAPSLDAKGLPVWQKAVWRDFPVQIELDDPQELARLLAAVPIASFERSQVEYRREAPRVRRLVFTPRVTEAEAAALMRAGYVLKRLPDQLRAGRLAAEAAWAERADKTFTPAPGTGLDYYPTYEQVGQMLDQLAVTHPDLCRTFTWGSSVLGRDLYGVVISADVHNTAAEPEVRLSSTMHGNEPPDMIMLLNLASYLLENYGQAGFEDVTDLIDNYEIHLMPLHNPDGYVAGSRYNDNGVDLNRDYPEPDGTNPYPELENLNFMDYATAHDFVISQNGHAGALVVNYPWDYTYDLAPDNDALILLSLEYSTYNLPMYNGSFDQGITNGAEWYIARGTLQDWSLYVTGCLDVTIEISVNKWPAASLLPNLWDDNRESLLHFIKAARYGVNGVVTDETSGDPLAATVTVTGNAQPVITDAEHGDYYKLLPTGTYTLTFAAEGYAIQEVSGVSTVWGTPTVLDVQLAPLPSGVPESREPTLMIAARPNPFNPATTLSLVNPRAQRVSVRIFDAQGRRVRVLREGYLAGGAQDLLWDGCDDRGTALASGVYFARFLTQEDRATAKLMLVR